MKNQFLVTGMSWCTCCYRLGTKTCSGVLTINVASPYYSVLMQWEHREWDRAQHRGGNKRAPTATQGSSLTWVAKQQHMKRTRKRQFYWPACLVWSTKNTCNCFMEATILLTSWAQGVLPGCVVSMDLQIILARCSQEQGWKNQARQGAWLVESR